MINVLAFADQLFFAYQRAGATSEQLRLVHYEQAGDGVRCWGPCSGISAEWIARWARDQGIEVVVQRRSSGIYVLPAQYGDCSLPTKEVD